MTYLGCFEDSRNRTLPTKLGNFNNNTPANCMEMCWSRGHEYSGVQFSRECFCGAAAPADGLRKDDAECGRACSGDRSLKCGDGWRNSVYTYSTPGLCVCCRRRLSLIFDLQIIVICSLSMQFSDDLRGRSRIN